MTPTKPAAGAWDTETLADGAIVLKASYQLNWVYLTVVKAGRVTRRRYRHDARVALAAA